MDSFEEKLIYQQKILNDIILQENFDLSSPAVLEASVEYDRLTNEWMGLLA